MIDILNEKMKKIPYVNQDNYYQLEKEYGEAAIKNFIDDVVSSAENYYKNNYSMSNSGKDSIFFKMQKELWNHYGFCFAMYQKFPFKDFIVEYFNCHSESSFDRFSTEDEVCYGFQLLFKKYITFLERNNSINLSKVFDKIYDMDTLKVSILLLQDCYSDILAKSNNDREVFNVLSLKEKQLGNLIYDNSKIDRKFIDEVSLFCHYKRAVDKFKNNNLGLSYFMASHYANCDKKEVSEFIDEGFIAICKAINYYDIRYGYRFSTYAINCIKNLFFNNHANFDVDDKIVDVELLMSLFFNRYDRYPSNKELYSFIDSYDNHARTFLYSKNVDSFYNLIPDNFVNVEELATNKVFVEEFLDIARINFDDIGLRIFESYLRGDNFVEIGRSLGITKQAAHKRFDVMLEKITKKLKLNSKIK